MSASTIYHHRREPGGKNGWFGLPNCWSVPPSSRSEGIGGGVRPHPDRLDKPVFMSAETKISEIIRRRPFEEDEKVTPDGRVMPTRDAEQTCTSSAIGLPNTGRSYPAGSRSIMRAMPSRACCKSRRYDDEPEHVRVTDLLKARQS